MTSEAGGGRVASNLGCSGFGLAASVQTCETNLNGKSGFEARLEKEGVIVNW